MSLILKLVSRLLALAAIALFLLYAYGVYLMGQPGNAEVATGAGSISGNGYGGEAGLRILDSKVKTREYFWVGDDLLLFSQSRSLDADGNDRDHYIWHIGSGEISPINIPGTANCYLDSHLYYLKSLNPKRMSNVRPRFDVFRAEINRDSSGWMIARPVNVKDIWPLPSERWQRTWRPAPECSPWFYLSQDSRLPTDFAPHYFISMPEWGWIYRRPSDKTTGTAARQHQMGFIDLQREPYIEQQGRRVSGPLGVASQYSGQTVFRYIPFLDRYWIATRLYHDPQAPRYLGLVDRSGNILKFNWPANWQFYEDLPWPSRKGLFWASLDYRQARPDGSDFGAFIYAGDGAVHKVAQGGIERISLSPDGCKLAFYHTPGPGKFSESGLRVFHACKSSIHGKEMTDVDYRDRPG